MQQVINGLLFPIHDGIEVERLHFPLSLRAELFCVKWFQITRKTTVNRAVAGRVVRANGLQTRL